MKYIRLISLNALIILFSAVFAFISIQLDNYLNFKGFHSKGVEIIGFGIVLVGLFFRIKASIQFYKHDVSILTLKAQRTLIKDGIFSRTRNPLYIGILLIFLGCILVVSTMSGIVLFILSFILCNWWVKNREERYMEKAFTNEYRNYKKSVSRWI